MPAFLRWTGRILLGLMILLIVGAAVVYALSARILNAPEDVTGSAFAIPDDSASVAEGKRLATVRGCNGCHGEDAKGQVMVDEPVLGRLVAPSLPDLMRRESPERIDRAVRRGIGVDGRALVLMPSEMYFDLSDQDLGRIVAWLRSVSIETEALPSRSLRLARLMFVTKRFQPAYVHVPSTRRRFETPAPGDTLRLGEYVARTSCPECHGLDLMGDPASATPSLALVAGYTADEFSTFLRTGLAKGGRELELMSDIARSRLSHLTDEEATGLRLYLTSLAGSVP
jgi:cytochrome c553